MILRVELVHNKTRANHPLNSSSSLSSRTGRAFSFQFRLSTRRFGAMPFLGLSETHELDARRPPTFSQYFLDVIKMLL